MNSFLLAMSIFDKGPTGGCQSWVCECGWDTEGVCLTCPDPTLLSNPRPKETKQPVLSGYCHLLLHSLHTKPLFQMSLMKQCDIYIDCPVTLFSGKRHKTGDLAQLMTLHRNSLVLTSIWWQHCFGSNDLECVAHDQVCLKELAPPDAKHSQICPGNAN